MENKKASGKDSRVRNWTFVLYPESAPDDWRTKLDDEHIQWIESPLHDKDTNGDGTPKKPHIHIVLLFEGKKSYEQIATITNALNATIPQRCLSLKGSTRYMAHLDNPEKAQYSTTDIIGHGGVDVSALLKPTSACRYQLIREMITFVNLYNIYEFSQLVTYAAVERFDDWFPLLCDNSSYIMDSFIRSRREAPDAVDLIVNRETGEINLNSETLGKAAASAAVAERKKRIQRRQNKENKTK